MGQKTPDSVDERKDVAFENIENTSSEKKEVGLENTWNTENLLCHHSKPKG